MNMTDLKVQYEKIKVILNEDRDLKLTDEDALRYQDVLLLLEKRGYIHNFNIDGMNWYYLCNCRCSNRSCSLHNYIAN